MAKSRFVVIRQVAPQISKSHPTMLEFQPETVFPSRPRSAIKTEKIHYDELNISDDEYGEENADIANEDHAGKWKT